VEVGENKPAPPPHLLTKHRDRTRIYWLTESTWNLYLQYFVHVGEAFFSLRKSAFKGLEAGDTIVVPGPLA
jgi:hypothetical protein